MARKLRVILFGAGLVGRQSLPNYIERANVIAFADNDAQKQGTKIHGIDVVRAEEIQGMDSDLIIITSTSAGQIMDQLLKMGIKKENVLISGEADSVINRRFPWDAVLFLLLMMITIMVLIVGSVRALVD